MISQDLARWALGSWAVPAPVRQAALASMLDGLGTALGAARFGSAQPATTVAAGLGGPAEATILGSTTRVAAPNAALANGVLVHALDFDDTHAAGLVHATSVVLPAALAVGQQVGANGAQVLQASVVGYEVVCRVAAAAPHGFHSRGLHATMVAGVFSSAAVAARLARLTEEQTVAALGIAGSQASGLLAFLGTTASTKALHPGLATHSGLLAARLAAAGATGPESVFEGPYGVFDALAAPPFDPASIVEGLGTRWETTQIGIKPYPVCQLSHATLDAVRDAQRRRAFLASEVEDIVARVHPDSAAVVADTRRDLTRPGSAYAAKFSLPWSVAALLTNALTVDAITDRAAADDDLADLAARVSVTIAPTDGPAADAPGDVTVRLRSGDVVSGRVARSAGGPSTPLTRSALLDKFMGNAGPGAEPLVDLIEHLDEQRDLDHLFDLAARQAVRNHPEGHRP